MDIFHKPPLNSPIASFKHLITAVRKGSYKNPYDLHTQWFSVGVCLTKDGEVKWILPKKALRRNISIIFAM